MTNTYQGITGFPFARTCAITLTIVSASLVAQTAPYDSAKPLTRATLFAPGIISTGDYESHPTFTPDGREIYFLKMAPNFSRGTIFVSRYKDGAGRNRRSRRSPANFRTPIPTSPLM